MKQTLSDKFFNWFGSVKEWFQSAFGSFQTWHLSSQTKNRAGTTTHTVHPITLIFPKSHQHSCRLPAAG